jgi:small subunit ribosomal protein S16
MAVKLRLMRVGKTKAPVYRVVAADARSPRDGRFIEIIGQYNPRHNPSLIVIDNHRAVKWLRNGAQPTERVAKLLQVSGAMDAFKAGILPDPPPKPEPTPKKVVTFTPAMSSFSSSAGSTTTTATVAAASTESVATLADTSSASSSAVAASSDSHDGDATVTTTVTVTTIVDGVETTETLERTVSHVDADSVPDYNPDTTDTTVIRTETTLVDGHVVESSETMTSVPES